MSTISNIHINKYSFRTDVVIYLDGSNLLCLKSKRAYCFKLNLQELRTQIYANMPGKGHSTS